MLVLHRDDCAVESLDKRIRVCGDERDEQGADEQMACRGIKDGSS